MGEEEEGLERQEVRRGNKERGRESKERGVGREGERDTWRD